MADTIARAKTKFPIDIPPNRAHTFGNVTGNITETAAGGMTGFPARNPFPVAKHKSLFRIAIFQEDETHEKGLVRS
jgi:hypothetical protein